MDLVVRAPRDGDAKAMEALYRTAFSPRMPGRLRQVRFRRDEALVAVLGDEIVGVGCYEPAGPDLDLQLGLLRPEIRRWIDPLADVEDVATRIDAPLGLVPERGAGDLVFSALAVHPQLRRRGVGRALTLHRLELATEAGAPQVFVHCVAGSGSRALYLDLGFVPLVHLARDYRDGTGMSLLYRQLGVR